MPKFETENDTKTIQVILIFFNILMATISLCVRETQKNADGTFTIKVAIGSLSRTTYIATRYKIDNIRQWKEGKVVRHPDAEYINRQLKKLLWEYEEIYDNMPNPDVSAAEIRKYILSQHGKSDSLKDYANRHIERLRKEKSASYVQNMEYTLKYLLGCFGESMSLQGFTVTSLSVFEKYLGKAGSSDTTINIRMTHLKALLNSAVTEGIVEYKIFPFRGYRMPEKNVREIWVTREELKKLREATFSGVSGRRLTVARDLFMLSFYMAGINLTDLMDAHLDGETVTFVRKKTADKKKGEKAVSLTIQPEARAIIDKYITKDGRLDFGYRYSDYGQFRSFVTKSLNRIGEELGFENRLMYYSARKTFVQFGQQLGIPIHVLEYSIGQSIKEANRRPIFDYMRVMRNQADWAVKTVIDYSLDNSEENELPVPEWARRNIRRD